MPPGIAYKSILIPPVPNLFKSRFAATVRRAIGMALAPQVQILLRWALPIGGTTNF